MSLLRGKSFPLLNVIVYERLTPTAVGYLRLVRFVHEDGTTGKVWLGFSLTIEPIKTVNVASIPWKKQVGRGELRTGRSYLPPGAWSILRHE